jgi:hypothetical protein
MPILTAANIIAQSNNNDSLYVLNQPKVFSRDFQGLQYMKSSNNPERIHIEGHMIEE